MSLFTPVRRRLKTALGTGLAAVVAQPPTQSLELEGIESVAIVRPNTRIGNTLFLLPLLDVLSAIREQPWVDLIVGNEAVARDLLGQHPVVRDVHGVPNPWVHPGRYRRVLRSLRRSNVDLIIDPSPNSTTGRLWMALSRSSQRLGFATPSQWIRLTHPVVPREGTISAWHEPLTLLSNLELNHTLWPIRLPLSARDLQDGKTELECHVGRRFDRPLVGFFREARGDKRLSDAWWREWLEAFSAKAKCTPVQVLHKAEAKPVASNLRTVHSQSLRRLGAMMAHLDLFVSCDTGPMHLAAAADTPLSTLFSHTDSKVYGHSDNHNNQIIELAGKDVNRVVSLQVRHLNALALQDAAATGS